MRVHIPNEHPFAKPHSNGVDSELYKGKDGNKDGDKSDVSYSLIITNLQGLRKPLHLERLSYQVLYGLNTVEGLNNTVNTCSAIPLAFS